jgi:hypothetical protein
MFPFIAAVKPAERSYRVKNDDRYVEKGKTFTYIVAAKTGGG